MERGLDSPGLETAFLNEWCNISQMICFMTCRLQGMQGGWATSWNSMGYKFLEALIMFSGFGSGMGDFFREGLV